jgi:hypothetical protein
MCTEMALRTRGASHSTGTTFLSEKTMPSLEEIGRTAEFAPEEITPA